MAISKKSEQVPKLMQEKFDRITTITNDFAQQHLNDEYAQLIRYATAALCRKRPSPLTTGKDQTWACGITHAVGMVNFVFDSIEIKGSSTLQDLHEIFFTAFDRKEAHMYEFQVGGNGPGDPNARRYSMKYAEDDEQAGAVETTIIAALGLSVDESFGYLFDFGDDWWHQVRVVSISDDVPKKKYPCITSKVGASPPQYANF